MTTNSIQLTLVQNGPKNNEHKVNLESQSDTDWTRAIHHELNIKRRTCTTFIPKTSTKPDSGRSRDSVQCGCNRLHREHSWNIVDGDTGSWDRKKHTTSAYNNAYGYTSLTHAHYIRCDIETDPMILAKLMFDVWKVKEPQLIICIIGGAKYFKLNERLEREFIKGIIQAALKADGWIVTSGFKTGAVQLVGEAIHDHIVTNPRDRITAIGCAKWGATKNREALLRKSIANANLDTSMNISKKEKGQQILEPNHTHFLLLDDGTYYGYDTGDYRTRFVIAASLYKKDVPIVTIVVEGGPDTLSTIYKDLRSSIPVVLIDGSGRIPNLLAKFLNRTESMVNRDVKDDDTVDWKQEIGITDINDIEKLKAKFNFYEDEIRDGLRDISGGSKTLDKIDELYNYFIYCLQPAVRSKIQIYSLDSGHNLDDTIFEAIIEAKQNKNLEKNKSVARTQLLLLALAWNAIEVAKEHIIKDDLNDLNDDTKTRLFLDALIRDCPQFVNTFIKLNFNVAGMFYKKQTNKPWKLKWEELAKLYNDDNRKNKGRRYLLHKYHGKDQIESEQELDQLLKKLIGDYMKSIYTRSARGILERLKICCQCSQGSRVADSHADLYSDDENDDSEVPDPEAAQKEVRELVYRDLFFWSILTNRIEMSKVIISHMQTRICAALIASKILKSYQKIASDNESKEYLSTHADQFEEYANEYLKSCYNADEETACELAIRRINVFGGVTCLQVAVDADNKNFVGQPCCDQLLDNIWCDKMNPFQSTLTKRFELFLSIITFGLLAPIIVSFRKEKSSEDDSPNKRKRIYEMTVNQTEDEEETKRLLPKSKNRLNNRGINYSDNYIGSSNYCSKRCLKYFRHLKQFHEAPYVKFVYNCASYIFFLLLFSYTLLFNFNIPTNTIPCIHWTEILVIIIVSTMLIEDARQFLCQDNRTIIGKLSNSFINNLFSTSVRFTSYLLFYIGLILRFTYASNDTQLSAAKIVLAYDLEVWFIRSLGFIGVQRKMGPKLVMIRRMLIDLSFFTYIILIAMIAYGVTSRSMYNFNNTTYVGDLTFDGRSIFRQILYPTYYLMYGEMDNELQALDENPDSSTAIATQVLLAFHMLFVNILLINLLIAMFSFTFQLVQEHTDLVWRYERYILIREYFDRPPLFPPFIIITHIIELAKLMSRHFPKKCCSHVKRRQAKTFKMIGINREIDKNWSEFEGYATNLYARTVATGQPPSTVALLPSKTNHEAPQKILDAINVSSLPSNLDIKAITDEMASIKRTVGDLRNYAEEMNRCMQWMMDAIERVKMSKEPKPILKSAVTTNGLKQTDE